MDAIDSPVVADNFATYVWGPNGIVSELRGGVVNYYHGDALGTTRAMTTQGRTQTDTRETDAFGNLWGPGSNLATPTPFGYAGAWGYQTDADSGLMLLGHRYYDASVGRFISRDPAQAGYNWYAYADNDPVNFVDPEGLAEQTIGELVDEVKRRRLELLEDKFGMYGKGGDGEQTWGGHQEQYRRKQRALRRKLKENAESGNPIPVPEDAHKVGNRPVPERPAIKPETGRGSGGTGPNWKLIGAGTVVAGAIIATAIFAPEFIPGVVAIGVKIITNPGLSAGPQPAWGF